MIQKIIRFSVKNKLVIVLGVMALIISGIISMQRLPVDAVPDITNNQVQIVTVSSSLAPQEVEQFITFPVETSMANIPGVVDVRSISRFGLSVITVVFDEDIPILQARQFVKEQIDVASGEIPPGLGAPEMMPITTGLGEIYQYVLQVDEKHKDKFSPQELRTLQDWVVKKQLAGVQGIIDVSSFGGFLKQYEVSVDPFRLQSFNVSMIEVFDALEKNNQNSGGSYIEQKNNAFYIRTEGLVQNISDIENIVVKANDEAPVLIRDIAQVKFGNPPRYGAMTMDGKGEAVGGITLMLKGANSSEAIDNVHERIDRIQKMLPEGVTIYPYLDRSVLVGKTIYTVGKNLIEGGLIVIFVLVLLLGNFRAGIIVASVIPLSLLFAFILMNYFGVSANLMSLGAIDFGIVVDGAVIVVEGVLHLMYSQYQGKKLNRLEMDNVIVETSSKIIGSAAFGVLIIIVVFVPILTLTGIEGKMFKPMAQTVSFAILGALLLSITYVPMMSALILKRDIKEHKGLAEKIVEAIQKLYKPTLEKALKIPVLIISMGVGLLLIAVLLFNTLGAEFVPTLDEGDLAMQVTIDPGSSLTHMVETTSKAEKVLKEKFPEVKHVVSKIGTAEIPTDPMAVEDADVMILLKNKDEWTSATDREELVDKMKKSLEVIDWAQFDFTQPIELRFNELISGSKSDVAIKLYGEDLLELSEKGNEIVNLIKDIPGAGDVKVEQTEGLPQLMIRYNREKLAFYQLTIEDLNKIIRSAYAGENAGVVYEGQRRFDLTVRLDKKFRENVDLGALFINTPQGQVIPLSEVAYLNMEEGPMQISRENAQRRISVGVNVRNRDMASFVGEVQKKLGSKLKLKPGYYIDYGGQFENLEAAKSRLAIAVPVALAMIFFLLYLAFRSIKYALMIYVTVPLAAVGGVFALLLRGMPFSISAGVGFIALFGVAVLNGIVLINYFNRLNEEGYDDIEALVIKGSLVRLRPVIMTAAVASLGFLPMALATSAGAEVQKPLATVVIGGLISSTLLTLIVLPVIYKIGHRKSKLKGGAAAVVAVLVLMLPGSLNAQTLTKEMVIDSALQNNPEFRMHELEHELVELDRKSIVSLGNTNAMWQQGQINSSFNDRYVEVDQVLGNPLSMSSQLKMNKALMEYYGSEEEIIKKQITRDVSAAWIEWLYMKEMYDKIEAHIALMEEYLHQVKVKKELGDVGAVDLSLAEIQKAELLKQLSTAKLDLKEAEQHLRLLSGIRGEMSISGTLSNVLESSAMVLDTSGYSEALISAEVSRLEVLQSERRTHRAEYFPEFSVGYFNQTLDHVTGYQGLKVGVSVPILDRSKSIDVRRSNIQIDYQKELINYEMNRIISERNKAVMRQSNLLELYNDYASGWQSQAEILNNASEAELSSGAIDYYVYLQAKSKVLDIDLMGLEIMRDLIISAYDVEYYTK